MTNTSSLINATSSEYCPKIKFKFHPANPLKPAEFLWLFKNREANGFKEAFIKVTARNFLVHVPTFTQCLTNRRGA